MDTLSTVCREKVNDAENEIYQRSTFGPLSYNYKQNNQVPLNLKELYPVYKENNLQKYEHKPKSTGDLKIDLTGMGPKINFKDLHKINKRTTL